MERNIDAHMKVMKLVCEALGLHNVQSLCLEFTVGRPLLVQAQFFAGPEQAHGVARALEEKS